MFVAKDIWGRSAWYVATENSKVQLFQKLWELAKIVLTEEELNNKMFIIKNIISEGSPGTWHRI